MSTFSLRRHWSRLGLRAALLVPSAMALTLLAACSSTTSGQGAAAAQPGGLSAAQSAAPVSAPAAQSVAPALSVTPAPAVSAPAVSAAAVSAPAVSAAAVSAAAVSAAPAPVSPAPVAAPSPASVAPVSSAASTPASVVAPPAPITVTATETETDTATVTSPSSASPVKSSVIAPATAGSSGKNVLGPYGYRGVLLGESQPNAKADSIFASTPSVTVSCKSWETIPAAAISSVLMSAKLGIADITPRDASTMQTPEGMTAGWTAAQVHAAYPSFDLGDTHEEDGGPEIAVPQNSKAAYKVRFNSSDKVVGFTLLLRNQNCFG